MADSRNVNTPGRASSLSQTKLILAPVVLEVDSLRLCCLVMIRKYARPANAATMLHASWLAAWLFTLGVRPGAWYFEMIAISRMMLTANCTILMTSGTSGRSSALVAAATAYCMADDNAEKAEIQHMSVMPP